jgi:STE24 endopeptidase
MAIGGTSTVWLVKASDRVSSAAALALAAGSAWAARRLLEPRESLPAPVPVTPADYFSEAEIAAGRRYARPQLLLGLSRSALEIAALVALARRSVPAPGARLTSARRTSPRFTPGLVPHRASSASPLLQALSAGGTGAAITVGLTGLKLPLSALSERRSRAAGLSIQDWSSWIDDLVKATAIEAGLSAVLLAGSSAVASRSPRRWWLVVAGGGVAVAALASMLAPVLTDPLFNDFDPLPDGDTRRDVLELAAAAGVDVGEVYSVDASRRSTAVNAYVNGLGPTKRVVLFDTLLAQYSRAEVRFVVAHELGHVRHRDVPRLITFLALCAPATTLAVQQLTAGWAGGLAGARAVPALLLSSAVATLPVGVAATALSRAIERRTDDFGLELSGAPEALISFFRQVAVEARADVAAGPITRGLLSTHPPITERIGAALAFERATERGLRPRRTPAGS